ncbi:unnamed protein product [Rotaria socialis]|uniref:Uncharacterized protein n=1 Tax=Rotaria socialis TaxID=392032 RepID=A0A821IHR7_9BILA|nr:unnamed protein product [Rotaria socialis]
MNQAQAYRDLGRSNLLESLVNKTSDVLYGLWRNKHITQKQYERLKVVKEQAEIAHLCFLRKAHKPKAPLRSIMADFKSPTIAISRWLYGLLRPLFNRLANETTILNGSQLVKQIEQWSARYLTTTTSFITMDATDLYRVSQE